MSVESDRRRLQLVVGLLRRLHLERLSQRYNPTVVVAVFNFINGSLSMGLLAAVALATGESFIFPSLGATAFLLFHVPLASTASPRNVLLGHSVGAIVGWLSLVLFGLLDSPPALVGGVDWPRVGAAALSLGGTSCLMILLRSAHPPAGATALIVSLGMMPELAQLPILLGAVSLLLVQAFVINRLAGIPFPMWSGQRPLVGQPGPAIL